MRCHACSHENPPGVRTCRACGEPLTESAAASPGTGFDVNPASAGGMTGAGTDFGVPAERVPPPGPHPSTIRFEHYEILRKEDGSPWELGRGAMGITYKAQDTDLHIPVALKVINPSTLESGDALDRFMREARAAAKLRHANIASVFRLGKTGDTHLYAMEFCEGQTVHQLVERRGPLELRLALEVTRQVTEALVVAQDHGVVHRDIKPSNLMITGRVPDEFTVKVIDFGLAKHTSADAAASDITISSHRRGFVGTAHFASPEQLEDRSVDFRADIYSLGVTLWFMLTGRPLFEGSLTRVVTQHIMQAPPLEKLSWLPTPVAELLDSMLAKTPEQRPRSCRDLRSRIQRCVDELDAGSTLPAVPNDRTVAAIHPPSSAPGAGSYAGPAVSAHPSAVPAAATMPTQVPPSAVPPPGPPPLPLPTPTAKAPEPAPAKKHRPTAQPVLIIGAVFALLAVLAVAGLLLAPVLKRMTALTRTGTAVSTPVPISTPAPTFDRDFKDAFRDARDAQRAAEELSMTMMRFDANRELIALATKNGNGDGLKVYSRAEQALEITRLDAENAFLISAKRLNAYPPEASDKAYKDIEEEVSKAGVGWRTRVAQMLPKYVAGVTPEMVRVDPGFLNELKELQPKP
jgi:serine/threonine protein kinase